MTGKYDTALSRQVTATLDEINQGNESTTGIEDLVERGYVYLVPRLTMKGRDRLAKAKAERVPYA